MYVDILQINQEADFNEEWDSGTASINEDGTFYMPDEERTDSVSV